ncbi:MAG: type I secretion C-terminal target domain-containing protein [Porticoccaceae bacterium]
MNDEAKHGEAIQAQVTQRESEQTAAAAQAAAAAQGPDATKPVETSAPSAGRAQAPAHAPAEASAATPIPAKAEAASAAPSAGAAPPVATEADENSEFAELQRAVAAGKDLSKELEPPAAGQGGSSSDSIAEGIRFERGLDARDPTAGFDPDIAPPPLLTPTADSLFVAEPVVEPPPPPDNGVAIGGLTPAAEGGDVSVNEANLADGSAPNPPALTQTGSFTVSAPDGLDSLTIGGALVLDANGLTGNPVTTPLGNTLVVTGYDPVTGVVTYQYTLGDNEAHPQGQGANNLFDNLPVMLTDSDGDTIEGQLAVRIVDDLPNAISDIDEVGTGGSTGGNVFTGADDDPLDRVEADVPGADRSGAPITGVIAGAHLDAPITDGSGVGAVIDGQFGTLVLNADGSYVYTADGGLISNQTEIFTYTVTDADGDTDTATLTIQIQGEAPPSPPPPPPPPPTIAVGGPDTGLGDITVPEGTDAIFGVKVTGAAAGSTLSLTLAPSGANPATEGSDYKAGTFQYSLDGGTTWTTITEGTAFGIDSGDSLVLVKTDTVADGIDEADETFTLTGTLNSGGDTVFDTGTATIVDGDVPTIAVGGPDTGLGDITVPEGTDAIFGVKVTGAAAGSTLSLTLAPSGANPATEGSDYKAGTFQYSLDGGTTWTTITEGTAFGIDSGDSLVLVKTDTVADGIDEADETFTLTGTLNSGGDTVFDTGTATIVDGDDPPRFIVGSNEDDVPGSTAEHVVPNPDGPANGPIVGGNVGDILVGDPGGSQLTEGQTANILMVLDTSSSMDDETIPFNGGNITRIQALKNATIAALEDLTATGAENIRVHLTEFNTHSAPLGTYDLIVNGVVNTAALNQAIADINALGADGGTNYEAGLGTAAQWISGNLVVPITQFTEGDHNSATGTGNDDDAALLKGADGTAYALVSGWGSTTADLRDARGDTSGGWGVEDSGEDLDPGEVLRFDFGPGTDFDGSGTNFTTDSFNGPPITAATFALRSFGSGDHAVSYTVTYSNGTSATVPVNFSGTGAHIFAITAPGGSTIDHIAFSVPTGQKDGYVDLESVTLSVPGPIAGADVNNLLFISDGVPTYHYVGDGTSDVAGPGNSLDPDAIAHITGTGDGDTVSEVGAILGAGFAIQAVGINVGETALDVLDQVEGQPPANPGDHSADNIHTAEELTDVVGGAITGGGTVVDTAGSDQISGGDGNDILFGDAPFTDDLANAQGLTTPDGAGWLAFEQLEAGQGTDPTWDRADTIGYIQSNLSLVAGESGRSGGHDVLDGGAGNDTIFGQEGNDRITGGLGDDLLSGGSGNDTFVWNAGETGTDTITGFTVGGDVLDLSELLQGEESADLSGYLSIAGDTLQIDADGGGNFGAPDQAIVLQGVTTDLNTLVSSGSLVTDHP